MKIIIICILLSIVSTSHVYTRIIYPYADVRIDFTQRILANEHFPPYKYRVLKPALYSVIQTILPIESERTRHIVSWIILVFVVFWLTFFLFYRFLEQMFPWPWPVIGLLFLYFIIPSTITGGYGAIGDFITLLFYIIGLILIFKHKDNLVPFVVAMGAFNREQIIWLIVFHFAYLVHTHRLIKCYPTLVWSIIAYGIVFLGLRFGLGWDESKYTFELQVAKNLNMLNIFNRTIPIWLHIQIEVLFVLSIMVWSRSNKFFRISLLSLPVYIIFWFFFSNFWEMAKFLPALLILIPMSLQGLTQPLNRR